MNESSNHSDYRKFVGSIMNAPVGALSDVAADICFELRQAAPDVESLNDRSAALFGRLAVEHGSDNRRPSIAIGMCEALADAMHRHAFRPFAYDVEELFVAFSLLCEHAEVAVLAKRVQELGAAHGEIRTAGKVLALRLDDSFAQGDGAQSNLLSLAVQAMSAGRDVDALLRFGVAALAHKTADPKPLNYVVTRLLSVRALTREQRLAVIPIMKAWMPYEVEDIEHSMIHRILDCSWVPLPVKMQLAFHCAPTDEYVVLTAALAKAAPDINEEMLRCFAPPVRIVVEEILAAPAAC